MIEGDIIRAFIAIIGIGLVLYGEGYKGHLECMRLNDIKGDLTTELAKRQLKFRRCRTCTLYGSLLIGIAVVSWSLA